MGGSLLALCMTSSLLSSQLDSCLVCTGVLCVVLQRETTDQLFFSAMFISALSCFYRSSNKNPILVLVTLYTTSAFQVDYALAIVLGGCLCLFNAPRVASVEILCDLKSWSNQSIEACLAEVRQEALRLEDGIRVVNMLDLLGRLVENRKPVRGLRQTAIDLEMPERVAELFDDEISGGQLRLAPSFYKSRTIREGKSSSFRQELKSDLGPERIVDSKKLLSRVISKSLSEENLSKSSDPYFTGINNSKQGKEKELESQTTTRDQSYSLHSEPRFYHNFENMSDVESVEDEVLDVYGDLSDGDVSHMTNLLKDWNFGEGGILTRIGDTDMADVFRTNPLTSTFAGALRLFGCLEELDLKYDELLDYMECIESKYLHRDTVLYHNSLHATCVLHSTTYILSMPKLQESLVDPALATFAAIFSAAIHDVAHPGTTQAFQIKTQSQLAVTYSDRSVLEHYHLAIAFSTIRENEKYMFLENKQDMQVIREKVIQMVLATDLASHIQNLEKLKELIDSDRPLSRMESRKTLCSPNDDPEGHSINVADTNTILCAIVHCADIGNTMKDWSVYKQWIPLIFEEFFKQSDKELELGVLVSFQRDSCFPCQMQIYFLDIFVTEFVETMVVWCPSLGKPLLQNIAKNKTMLALHNKKTVDQLDFKNR